MFSFIILIGSQLNTYNKQVHNILKIAKYRIYLIKK